MDNDEIAHVSKTNFAKNKILDQQPDSLCFSKSLNKIIATCENQSGDAKNLNLYLGKTIVNINRPLTYPYTSLSISSTMGGTDRSKSVDVKDNAEYSNSSSNVSERIIPEIRQDENDSVSYDYHINDTEEYVAVHNKKRNQKPNNILLRETSPINENRKRKYQLNDGMYEQKIPKQDAVMDLSINSSSNKENGISEITDAYHSRNDENSGVINLHKHNHSGSNEQLSNTAIDNSKYEPQKQNDYYATIEKPQFLQNGETNYISEDSSSDTGKVYKHINDYDNSAMETLADIATRQMKLEKNSIAKNVATEFLKLATKHDSKSLDNLSESSNFIASNKDVNDLITKREENKSCTICLKNFSKPSQLRCAYLKCFNSFFHNTIFFRLHMNIHYLERPYRCESCSVSFRTKGHLQKHERSASHHNKVL